MSTTPSEIIFADSPDSANFLTNITGWVSSTGQYCGNDEQLARRIGATHYKCVKCNYPVHKSSGRTICAFCKQCEEEEQFLALPSAEWDGVQMLYSETLDAWAQDWDGVEYWLDDEEVKFDDLRIVLSTPVYAQPIDPYDHYMDNLPAEADEIPHSLQLLFDKLNEQLLEQKIILSWTPIRVRLKNPVFVA